MQGSDFQINNRRWYDSHEYTTRGFEILKDMYEDDIHTSIKKSIKELNKNLPIYKYIREFTLSNEPLIKTTTQKIKRHEEMSKINKQ